MSEFIVLWVQCLFSVKGDPNSNLIWCYKKKLQIWQKESCIFDSQNKNMIIRFLNYTILTMWM